MTEEGRREARGWRDAGRAATGSSVALISWVSQKLGMLLR